MEARLTSPIIVTGMHRSGTSMTAMLLAQHGVHMGERLIPGNRHNPRGYFEDADFVELQRSMLAAATAGGTRGWPDWGWTEDERFDTRKLASFAPQVHFGDGKIRAARSCSNSGRNDCRKHVFC